MARYINADKLIAHLEDEIRECKPPQGGRAGGKSIAYGTMLGLKSAIAFADALSTADVAPRSEVAREICCEIESEIVAALESNYYVKSERMKKPRLEMADEFIAHIEGKINALRGMEWFVAELKQKHTEDQK